MNTTEMIDILQRGTDRLSRKVLLEIASQLIVKENEIEELRRRYADCEAGYVRRGQVINILERDWLRELANSSRHRHREKVLSGRVRALEKEMRALRRRHVRRIYG